VTTFCTTTVKTESGLYSEFLDSELPGRFDFLPMLRWSVPLVPGVITIAGIFRGGRLDIVETELSIADIEEIRHNKRICL
jgi:hypothetical protein